MTLKGVARNDRPFSPFRLFIRKVRPENEDQISGMRVRSPGST